MKILDFETSLTDIENGKLELADITKTWLYQHAPEWFDVLDFEDDSIFLEPSLFYYFRVLMGNEKCTMPLEQILWGYIPKEKRLSSINVFTDIDGVIYLPNIGYILTNTEGLKGHRITFVNDEKSVIFDNKKLEIVPQKTIEGKDFLLLQHKPNIYNEKSHLFSEKIIDSVIKSEKALLGAIKCIETNTSMFFDAIKNTTREFAIFDSINYGSFAALHYFGTAFLSLAGEKQNEVFFVEDIAHQSGHIIFYTLTHDSSKFLKPHQDSLLRDFTNHPSDKRNIYGAFHGLFTYTTILHCLNTALQNKWFKDEKEEDALARIGFYYKKFEQDLVFQGDSRILTGEGWQYYDMFQSGFTKIKKEYYHIIKYFDYSNQDYNFNFKKFKEVNQFQTA